MARFIGIRHRIKRTAEGEARPTQVMIFEGEKAHFYDLPDDTAELDFVKGQFPVSLRKAEAGAGDDFSKFRQHHITWKEIEEEDVPKLPSNLLRREGKAIYVATKVPEAYDGLRAGDTVGMLLGGSGDRLAFALARQAEEIGATVLRIPPFVMKDKRGEDKDRDASNLAELVKSAPEIFFPVTLRDRNLIRLREVLGNRTEAMKARIGCEQRLRQQFVGRIFCSAEGKYPEGSIELEFDEFKANDVILANLVRAEKEISKELGEIISEVEIYNQLFEPIVGCGPMIAAKIITAISDIRLFATDAKLKKYLGVHVLPDSRFPRRRVGELANWKAEARQALYLLGDQFNKRPNSEWGQKLISYKAKLQAAHPEVILNDNGKKKYTKAHIHKMATWRTLTKFVEHLYREWRRIERQTEKLKKSA